LKLNCSENIVDIEEDPKSICPEIFARDCSGVNLINNYKSSKSTNLFKQSTVYVYNKFIWVGRYYIKAMYLPT
jgi:hypothetical protein